MTLVFLRSDPTENDSVEGLRPNARGPGLVTFGVSLLDGIHLLVLEIGTRQEDLIVTGEILFVYVI